MPTWPEGVVVTDTVMVVSGSLLRAHGDDTQCHTDDQHLSQEIKFQEPASKPGDLGPIKSSQLGSSNEDFSKLHLKKTQLGLLIQPIGHLAFLSSILIRVIQCSIKAIQ